MRYLLSSDILDFLDFNLFSPFLTCSCHMSLLSRWNNNYFTRDVSGTPILLMKSVWLFFVLNEIDTSNKRFNSRPSLSSSPQSSLEFTWAGWIKCAGNKCSWRLAVATTGASEFQRAILSASICCVISNWEIRHYLVELQIWQHESLKFTLVQNICPY